MVKKGLWILMAFFAIGVGLYPGLYFLIDRKFGLLNSKTPELLGNVIWNIGFYTHIIFGGLSLLIGWTQFNASLRKQKVSVHRFIGKAYVVFVLLSSTAGIYIGFYATGGAIAAAGFIGLGVTWFYTTLTAFLLIKNGRINEHQKMMVYSYAACFAAVTLRIWLPLLTIYFGEFITAYKIVAWLCWVPNIIVAYFIVRRLKNRQPIVVNVLDE